MNAIDLVVASFEELHGALREVLRETDPEWLWWQPAPGANHIGFLAWHIVRDEDTVVSYLTGRQETWVSEAWFARFGLGREGQGTGFDPAAVADFRFDPARLMEYAGRVFSATGPAIATLSEDGLDQPAWPGAAWTVARQLTEGCCGHSWLHLGEINCIRGLRGWRGRE